MMMLGTIIFFGLFAVLGLVALVFFLTKGTGALTQPRISFPDRSPHQEPGHASSAATRSCSHCGAGLEPGWSHCPQCGAPIQ